MDTSINPNDPALDGIKRLIEGKSGFEILTIHDELKRDQREPGWVAYLSSVLSTLNVDHDGFAARDASINA